MGLLNKHVWKWILKNAKGSIASVAFLTMLSVVLSLISLMFAVVSKDVFDIATKQAEGDLIITCVKLVVLLLVQLGIQISISFINVKANANMEINMKRNIFRNLISRDYLSISKYHSGELLNRLTSDVKIIVSNIISIVPLASLLFTSVIGSFVYLYILDKFFAVLILCVGPLLLISARLYSKKYKKLHKDCQEAEGKVRSFMQEALQNLIVIKSFSNQEDVLDHNEDLQNKSYHMQIKRVKVSLIAHLLMYITFNAGYYFAVAYCAFKLSIQAMTFGTVSAVLQLVNKIQSPFKDISGLVPKVLAMIASAERIMELEAMPGDEEKGDIVFKDIYKKIKSIEFENVSYAYEDKKVLDNVSFSVKKGEMAVIGGESGAGKSTAIKLMLGILHACEGDIYAVTDDGNIPLNTLTRSLFAYVPQGNLILSGTLRENITFGNKNATEEQIISAAKAAQIWDYICTLEKGLDTELGEKGLGLSEGQVQRISIARALLYDAPILLLDESTSALDSQTERLLLEELKQMDGKTCIIVSHKKAAFELCDNIIDYNKFERIKENECC